MAFCIGEESKEHLTEKDLIERNNLIVYGYLRKCGSKIFGKLRRSNQYYYFPEFMQNICFIYFHKYDAFYFNFSAVRGNGFVEDGIVKRWYKKDSPSLQDHEFISLGINEMLENEEIKAFVVIYKSIKQIMIDRLNFKRSLETAYNKPQTKTGQQVFVSKENKQEAHGKIETQPYVWI